MSVNGCATSITSPDRDKSPSCEQLETGCCIVGAGPAGMMLSLLLARAGVRVTLLEAHRDFDRDFRGDTIHSSTLEVLDQIGLADRLHELPHSKMREVRLVSAAGAYTIAVFRRLPTRYPYVMMMPQSRFLEFLADEGKKHAHFRLVMGASVHELIEEEGKVQGVAYRTAAGRHEIRAPLTIATDGRFSSVRKLAALEPVISSAPMEVLWFRLPRKPDDEEEQAALNIGQGDFVVLLGREQEWQVGYVVPKGGHQKLKARGVAALRQAIAATVPWLADRVELLEDWRQVSVLAVAASRLNRWHLPGLLVIGDAAHVMLPVGGVGINCAISDAVEAANVLSEALRSGGVKDEQLAEVQRRRERLTRMIQAFQTLLQRRIMVALESGKPFTPPLPLRIMLRAPLLRNIPARIMAFGIQRVRVEHPDITPVQ